MSKNSESEAVASENDSDETSDASEGLNLEARDTGQTSLALIPYRPAVSSILQLIQLQPFELFRQIQSLENRVVELRESNNTLQGENSRLQTLTGGTERTRAAGTTEKSALVLKISSDHATSVHEVSVQPRFGFPSVTSVSFTNIRQSLTSAGIPSSSSDSTGATSPDLTVMYLRRGTEIDPISTSPLCASSSSHQLLVLRRPNFCDTELSGTSINDGWDSSFLPGRSVSSTSSIHVHGYKRKIVTFSLPHIVTFPSVLNISEDSDDESESEVEIRPPAVMRSHSWPSYRRPYIEDFTAYLSGFIDDGSTTSGSQSDLNAAEDDELEQAVSGAEVQSTITHPTNVSDADVPNAPNTDDDPEQSSIIEPEQPHALTSHELGTQYVSRLNNSIVEHPFIEPLRQTHEELVLRRNMFGHTSQYEPLESVPSGRRLHRRLITIFPLREHGMSSWAKALRTQIFLNVTLSTRTVSRTNNVEPEQQSESTDSINSLENEASDMSLLELEEQEEGNGEQMDLPDPNLPAELEEGPDADEEDHAQLSSSSSENSGQGDAETVDSESSTTSLENQTITTNVNGRQSPTFPYPSESNLGGKYGYLRAALRRPRAADGHRFVVSLFGTVGRKSNELNLPSWVPVYAERLECILNQFLEKEDSNQNVEPTMQVLHSVSPNQSAHSYKSVVTCTVSQEVRLELAGLSSGRNRQLKSCLRISRERSVGESIPKNLSWSQNIMVRNVYQLRPPSADIEDENNSNIPQKETSVKPHKTQSCPDLLIMSPLENSTESAYTSSISTSSQTENSKKGTRAKKKGFVLKFFGKLCCKYSKGLKKSF